MGLRGVVLRKFSLVICRKMGKRTEQQAPGAVGKESSGASPQQHQCPRASAHPALCTPQTLNHNVQGLVGRNIYLETEDSLVF